MATEAIYIDGMILKEKTFQDGGSLINASFKVEQFIEQLKKHEKGGWANFTIMRSNKPSDKGLTHYVKLNTFNPDGATANGGQNMSAGKPRTDQPIPEAQLGDDDLPF